VQSYRSGRTAEQNGRGLFLNSSQLDGRTSVTTDHDGALLALHFLDETEAPGFELGYGHLHKMTMK